jgi:V/A-type H+/Na+-transporting ATPase subunit E
MEVKLENLIKKIKEEGVGAADKKAAEILEKTRKEAEKILEKAEKDAEKIREEAKQDAEKMKSNAEASIQQAARDTMLSLKKEIRKMFDRLLLQKIDENLDEKMLRDLIVKLTETWAKGKEVSVLAGKVDADELTSLVMKELKTEAKKGVEIKLDKKMSHGFRFGLKDDDLTYDFTDDALLESLRFFLSPKLAELLDKKTGK